MKKIYSVLTNFDLWMEYFFQSKNIFFLIGDTFGPQHCWNERLEVKVVVGDGEPVVVQVVDGDGATSRCSCYRWMSDAKFGPETFKVIWNFNDFYLLRLLKIKHWNVWYFCCKRLKISNSLHRQCFQAYHRNRNRNVRNRWHRHLVLLGQGPGPEPQPEAHSLRQQI